MRTPKVWDHENELPRGRQAPQILRTGLAYVSSRPQFVSSCRPHFCRYTPGWLVPFYLQPPLWALPPGHGALQRTAHKFPAHSVLDTLCQTPTAEHGAVAGWPTELEGWGMAGPHPCGPGNFGPVCQRSCCHGCTEPCQVRVASPPAAWPRHQITEPCHGRGEDWSPCMQPWQTTGLL